MKRTAIWIGISYTAGLLIASLLSWRFWPTLLGVTALTVWLLIMWKKSVRKYVCISTLSFLTACCVYWGYDAVSIEPQLAFAGQQNVLFTGKVREIREYDSGYAGYLLEGKLDNAVNAKLWYTCEGGDYVYGDTLTVCGDPEAMTSGYLFDASTYYRGRGIFLRMFGGEVTERVPRPYHTLRSLLYEWRMTMSERILAQTGERSGPMLVGMLFGDTSGMDSISETAMYRMGIGHVLAVSGLHLDFLALCAAWLLRRLKADKRLVFASVAVLSVLFVLCVGEPVSARRALIMILLSQSAGLFGRKADAFNSLSIAMFLLELHNPMVIHSAAFWLTSTATFGIAVFAVYMTKPMPQTSFWEKQKKSFAMFFCASLVLFPVLILYFHEVSLISPLSNLLLVPLCMAAFGLSAVSLLFGAQGFLAGMLLWTAELLAEAVLAVSGFVSSLPLTYTGTGSAMLRVSVFVGTVAIMLCYLFCRDRRLLGTMIAGVIAVTAAAAEWENGWQRDHLRIAVLGEERDCVLVIAKADDAVAIDLTGDSKAADYVRNYLESAGTARLDALIFCNAEETAVSSYTHITHVYRPARTMTVYDEENDGTIEFAFHDALIRVEGACVNVSYGMTDYLCCRETEARADCDVLTVFGRSRDVLPSCGVLHILDEETCYRPDAQTWIGENNLELTLAMDGRCRVRRLYGDS
ncbi:MAG: ComEC/Rec2 family competence protein [Oscillospiraceae bacterium]|nr:ComEC/Rec2 family competence protein [Oscillospiraceae bacterium]